MEGNSRCVRGVWSAHGFVTVACFKMGLIAKTLVYRAYSFVILFIVLYIVTRSIPTTLFGTAGIESIKLVEYYIFEKFIWKV